MPTEMASNHRQFSLTEKLPAAQQAEALRFAFAGMCFNVTALPVVPAVQVQPSLPALNFTLTT
jgi:hypothetical protein